MQPPIDFLTSEECAEVDKALLTTQDKFASRVAIYALRSLKQIALQNHAAIETLTPEQIEDWVYQDESLQEGLDREFRKFFAHLVTSSRNPLAQAAAKSGSAIADLSVSQVVAWFEQQAKERLQRN